MNHTRALWLAGPLGCLFALALTARPAAAQDADDFLAVLPVGGQVMLMGLDSGAYDVHWLTDEQVIELDAARDRIPELTAERIRLTTLLADADTLPEQVQLLHARLLIDDEYARKTVWARAAIKRYEVFQLGDGYVALRRADLERFVPSRSIRQIYRTAALPRWTSACGVPTGIKQYTVVVDELDPALAAVAVGDHLANADLLLVVEGQRITIRGPAVPAIHARKILLQLNELYEDADD